MKLIYIFLFLMIFSTSSTYALKDIFNFNKKSQSLDINRLSLFSDIVVIQRRYLPKTLRFEIAPLISLFFNSSMFIHGGVGGNLGFYFLEKHGIEIRGLYSDTLDRSVARYLENNLNFHDIEQNQTEFFVTLLYKWIPVYGKMAWFNSKIIPFEVLLNLGGGLVQSVCGAGPTTNASSSLLDSNLGVCIASQTSRGGRAIKKAKHIGAIAGAGLSFAFTRNSTFRVNVDALHYGTFDSDSSHTDILMSFFLSFYFPRKLVRGEGF